MSQENLPYHFRIGRPCPFLNGKVCPSATSEAGARCHSKITTKLETLRESESMATLMTYWPALYIGLRMGRVLNDLREKNRQMAEFNRFPKVLNF
jgi:hypothetical protein